MSAIALIARHLDELTSELGIGGRVVEAEGRLYVLLDKVPLPPGAYNLTHTDVMFMTDHQYPLSAMDMFWVEEELLRAEGAVPQGGDSVETYVNGRRWRRFSWHRQGAWRTTGNPLLDHFALMEARFAIEPDSQVAA